MGIIMRIYFIAESAESARSYALACGWRQIAAGRYATPEKDDIIVVRSPTELHPVPSGIKLLRGPDFASHPHAAAFERFVADGAADWFERNEATSRPVAS